MRTPRVARLVLILALVLLAAWSIAGFRGEDWWNIERGAGSLANIPSTLLGHGMPGFYRPLPDLVTGVLYQWFGLTPGPYLAFQLLLFALDAALLASIVKLRGGNAEAAWIAVAALGVQVNTYSWTVFWFSYVTGTLVTTFVLLAVWFHHRAVARAERGRSPVPAAILAASATLLAATCKEEVVLIPAILAAIEAIRWPRLGPAARRATVGAWIAIAAPVVVYLAFRFAIHPPELGHGTTDQYRLHFGRNWISNLVFFGFHLVPFPFVMATLGWWSSRSPRAPAPAGATMTELAAGAAWTVLSIQLYLPMGGHAYGLLYLPAFGVALGLAPWLATVPRPALRLATYAGFAVLITAWGLASVGWPRYRGIARETFAALDRAAPTPRPGAQFVFLDPMERETLSGRSVFNMVFDGAAANMVRLHYRRPDLGARVVIGPAALDSAAHPPVAEAVFLVRNGRMERVDRGTQVAKRPVR